MQEEGGNIKRGTGMKRDADLPLRNWPSELVVVPVSHIPSQDRSKRLRDAILWQQTLINVWAPLNRTAGNN